MEQQILNSALWLFFGAFVVLVIAVVIMLKGESQGIKEIKEIAHSKNIAVVTLQNEMSDAFKTLNMLDTNIDMLRRRADQHDAKFTNACTEIFHIKEAQEKYERSTNLEAEIRERYSDKPSMFPTELTIIYKDGDKKIRAASLNEKQKTVIKNIGKKVKGF